MNCDKLDHSNNAIKLLTVEALHIRKLRPGINTRDEYKSRELTIRFEFKKIFG